MLYSNYTEKLLGLQGAIIKNIETTSTEIIISIEIERKVMDCTCCGTATSTIHDYRTQPVKDIHSFGKNVTLLLRKRRYKCPHCGKRFAEKINFLPRYHRMTNRLVCFTIDKLREERSFSSVARELNLSVSTVIRIFDLVSYPNKPILPTTLAIDEFKGNAGGEKYLCILTDPVSKAVLDILPKRHENYLVSYFNCYERHKRDLVKYFVSDMWLPYYKTAGNWFKNADRVIDKYHWIRQVFWAFENVRKQEQKQFSKKYRRYIKGTKKLLFKRFDYLKDEQKQRVNIILYASVTLSSAHFYKEKFLEMLDTKDIEKKKQLLKEWIEYTSVCDIPQFEKAAETLNNWLPGILNSLDTDITNGFTEGCNNRIKVLKRNAYGYSNFNRFRNRILHIFSHQLQKNQQSVA